jgi:uncharacterized protein YbjT (DUF2867 family)
MVLVVGSTGILGGEICKLLARKGIPLRVLVRSDQEVGKVDHLRKFGAAVIVGNLDDPTSLAAACQGMQGIICTASAFSSYQQGKNDFQTVDSTGITNLIDIAEKSGVSRFIFPSFSSGVVMQSPLVSGKRDIEKYLRESALVYTIIRASFFMETWFSQAAHFDPLGAKAVIYGEGENPIHWVSCRNVAQLMVHSLYLPEFYNQTLELIGPEALSPREVVAEFEQAGQRLFQVSYIDENSLCTERKATPDPLRQAWLSLFLDYAHGDGMAGSAQGVDYPKRLISVNDYSTALYEIQHKAAVF